MITRFQDFLFSDTYNGKSYLRFDTGSDFWDVFLIACSVLGHIWALLGASVRVIDDVGGVFFAEIPLILGTTSLIVFLISCLFKVWCYSVMGVSTTLFTLHNRKIAGKLFFDFTTLLVVFGISIIFSLVLGILLAIHWTIPVTIVIILVLFTGSIIIAKSIKGGVENDQ